MRTWALPLLLLLGGSCLTAQEDCANAIDDDGDGLIDLNDVDDCSCALSPSTVSLLPNHSFESLDATQEGCTTRQPGGQPDAVNQANCLTDWQRASLGTTDAWNAFTLPAAGPFFPDRLPQPLPDGVGVAGFWVGIVDRPGKVFHQPDGTTTNRYREYLATILKDGKRIEQGLDYRLTFSLGFIEPQTADDGAGSVDISSPGPIELSIYGVDHYRNLDFGPFYTCPEEAGAEGYELLATFTVDGTPKEWTAAQVDFTAMGTYAGFAIGGSCSPDHGRADGGLYRNYYFIDNLVLNTTDQFVPPVAGPVQVDGLTTCEPVTLTAPATPGATYQWYRNGVAMIGADNHILVLQPDFSLDGRYVLKVTTAEGCAVSDEIDIQRPVITDMFADTLSACKAGDTLTIFPAYASAATFAWDDGSTDRARRVTEPGTYSVTVTEACITHTETIVVVYDEPFTYSVRTLPKNPCIGDTVTIEVTTNAYAPRYNFRSLPEGAMLPSNNGSLTVVAGEQTDILAFVGNGCETIMDTIYINASEPIAVAEPVIEHIVCGSKSGTIQLTLPQYEDIKVDWYDPQGRFIQSGGTRLSVNTPGEYSIHLSDGFHCDQRLRATVKETSGITATFATRGASCEQPGEISITELTGTAPFDITWSKEGRKLNAFSGRQSVSELSPGTYRTHLTDATGCTAVYDLEVAAYTPMTVSASATYVDCADPTSGSISVAVSGGVGPFTYQLADDAPQSTPDYSDFVAGTYTITVRDSFGCTLPAQTVVLAPPLVTAPRSPASELHHIKLGESVVLGNGTGEVLPPPEQVSWEPTRGLSCTDCMAPAAAPTETTQYTVTYSNGNGCSSSELVTVIVDERVDVYVPNAFSPNGDSQNDRFRAFPGRGVIAVTDLRVYDRWGELIWIQENAEKGWDGSYRGRQLNTAVFAYTGTVLLANGDQQQFSGSVTLVD